MSNSQLLKWYSLRLLAVAFVIGFLSTSNAALIGYIAGTGLTDQDGTVAAFSIAYLIGGTLFSTFVHFFIGAVASVFGFLAWSSSSPGARTATTWARRLRRPGGDAALIGFAKKFAVVVLLIAFALARLAERRALRPALRRQRCRRSDRSGHGHDLHPRLRLQHCRGRLHRRRRLLHAGGGHSRSSAAATAPPGNGGLTLAYWILRQSDLL